MCQTGRVGIWCGSSRVDPARSSLIHHYLMTDIYPATGVPLSRPFTLRSSSALGQWMPSPSPNSPQSARCSGDARKRRGKQANGAEMRRPSARTTVNSSSVTSTCGARGLCSTAKEPMPLRQKNSRLSVTSRTSSRNSFAAKTARRRQRDWLKPKLGEGTITLHMDMRWLAVFVNYKRRTETGRCDSGLAICASARRSHRI